MEGKILSNGGTKLGNGFTHELLQDVTVSEAAKILTKSRHGRRNIDDSFYIYDAGDVARRYRRWVELFPHVKPYFAVKSGPHKPLIKYLGSVGAGCDCASQDEIDKVMGVGVNSRDIIYSNPTKQASHIAYARSRGVNITVFDSEEELHKIKKYFPEAKLLLRMWTDGSDSLMDLNARFGVKVPKACHLLKAAKKLQLNVVGVCFHVGSPCTNAERYISALRDTKKLFEYAKTIGTEMNVINIGGGFPGDERQISLKQIADAVNQGLGEYFPTEEYKNLELMAEPGRYFSATSFTLVTNVIAKKAMSEQSKVKVTYTINNGRFASLLWYDHKITPVEEMEPLPLEPSDKKKLLSTLYGPTCDCEDLLHKGILFPEMEVGDWMIWKNCGAYTFAVSAGFNGFRVNDFYTIYSRDE